MSETLTDIYNNISDRDVEYLEKHAQQIKVAEEEDAAGRITARGFADELQKLSSPQQPELNPNKVNKMKLDPSAKVKAPKIGGGNTGGGFGLGGRSIKGPPGAKIAPGKGSFGQGSTVAPSGNIRKRPTFKGPGQ